MTFCSKKLSEELSKGEYEAQFFQTSALSLACSLKELIRSHVQKCLDKLNQTIEGKAENPNELTNAREIMKILRERYLLAIENQCKEMENKIYEVFNIPSHVLLPEDTVQVNQYNDEEERKMDEEIKLLELRYRRAICMEALLKKRRKVNKCVDLLEKTAFEIDSNVDTFRNVFEAKETNLHEIVDDLNIHKYLQDILQSLKTW